MSNKRIFYGPGPTLNHEELRVNISHTLHSFGNPSYLSPGPYQFELCIIVIYTLMHFHCWSVSSSRSGSISEYLHGVCESSRVFKHMVDMQFMPVE